MARIARVVIVCSVALVCVVRTSSARSEPGPRASWRVRYLHVASIDSVGARGFGVGWMTRYTDQFRPEARVDVWRKHDALGGLVEVGLRRVASEEHRLSGAVSLGYKSGGVVVGYPTRRGPVVSASVDWAPFK